MKINSIYDLCDYLGTNPDRISRDLYKYTDCGAWIEWDDNFVDIGSIVEGSDAEFHRTLKFPFDSDDYDDWICKLECLVDEAWHEANDEWYEKVEPYMENPAAIKKGGAI